MLHYLFSHPALMSAGDAHVLAVLRYGAASDLNALRLQDAGELLVGQRTAGIFFVDELLDPAFEDEQLVLPPSGPCTLSLKK
jgi:hypothetical protein